MHFIGIRNKLVVICCLFLMIDTLFIFCLFFIFIINIWLFCYLSCLIAYYLNYLIPQVTSFYQLIVF